MNLVSVWQRISAADDHLCLLVNRVSRQRMAVPLFRLVSRLGDGVFWYALMVVLPVMHGGQGGKASLTMAVVGAINLLLYRKCKSTFARERPYVNLPPINLAAAPLDRYSFPSGHTLHAVGFSIVATTFFPALSWVVYPFVFLVALSRPVLGLHYPSDVLVAAVIGFSVASGVLMLMAVV